MSVQKSAIVIIDMQNYFLSGALKCGKGAGHSASDNLLKYTIPAARKAGIQIIWLNWGLTDEDLVNMPPAITRCFGFYGPSGQVMDRHGKLRDDRTYAGLGSPIGNVTVPEDEGGKKEVDAGDLLMSGTWNAALYAPLDVAYEAGKTTAKPDIWIHKNRMSGLWGATSPCQEYLEKNGITTLFFAGVNTDQCVGGSLTDAFSKGYDCILLKDGVGTTSPECAQQAWEYNSENTFGFVMSCEQLRQGVEEWAKNKAS